jgi:serine/threonine protein kinase/tetratricopeptide (TPR) repeat protein
MTAWNPRANDLFLKALELHSPAERQTYLDGACAGNPALRAQVEALLQADAQAGSFLASPAVGRAAPLAREEQGQRGVVTVDAPIRERLGTVIGSYKLLEQIGEGGFGVVFLAEQQQPVRRKVALKLLKPGMDTRQVVARFEVERQALALMDHPNIAQVFDGGETPTGRPYFVMELVKGVPITDYCDQNRLSIRQRLELFAHVCQAVQHAHQKGIIHRDIKPSNVLVTQQDGQVIVKVIDFGIAKALGQQLTDKTLYTGFAEVIGTPLYMSPEQAGMSSLDIDTRSDIYSLGVLLYELLTGTTPFDRARLKEVGFDELRRIIREEEPAKPSTRLSTVGQAATTASEKRQSDPRKLSRMLRGELDWVVMKALEKDRDRRYETASAFAADVERYLHDEPVQARPPSAWYRFRKFTRRNKRTLAVAALIVAAVIAMGGIIGRNSWDKFLRDAGIEREVKLAQAESRDLQGHGKWQEALTAAEKAQAALASGEGSEDLRQRVQARLGEMRMLVRLESIWLRKGVWQEQQIGVRRIGSRTYYDPGKAGKWSRADPRVEIELAKAFDEFGIPVEKLEVEEAVRRIRLSGIAVELAVVLDDWADWRKAVRPRTDTSWKRLIAVARAADPDKWRTRLRDALEQNDRNALEQLATEEAAVSQPVVSQIVLANILIWRTRVPDTGIAFLRKAQRQHPGEFWINLYLANSLREHRRPKDLDDAVRFFQAAAAVRPQSAEVWLNLGCVLLDKGDLDEAIAVCRKAISLDPNCYLAHVNLGNALDEKALYEEAIAAYKKAIRIRPKDISAHINLGIALSKQKKFDKAIAVLKHAIELHNDDASAYYNLGVVLWDKKDTAAAIPYFKKAVRLEPNDFPIRMALAQALYEAGHRDQALAAYREAFRRRPKDAATLHMLGAALSNRGLHEEAVIAYREGFQLEGQDAHSLFEISLALKDKGLLDKAIAASRESIRLAPKGMTYYNLGCLYLRLGAYEEAITANQEAVSLMPDYAQAHCNLGHALRGAGRYPEALVELKRGHELGSAQPGWRFPSAQWVKECERLLEKADAQQDPATQGSDQLARILRGELQPVDAGERAEFARLCQAHGYNATAARLSAAGFDDLGAPARYLAACAAALAGTGQGKDAAKLDAKERARWRGQALAWLRPDLERMQTKLKKEPQRWRTRVLAELRYWQTDPRLATVREESALARLPEAERAAWRQFWAEVRLFQRRLESAAENREEEAGGRIHE